MGKHDSKRPDPKGGETPTDRKVGGKRDNPVMGQPTDKGKHSDTNPDRNNT